MGLLLSITVHIAGDR